MTRTPGLHGPQLLAASNTFWWNFTHTDCGYGDSPNPPARLQGTKRQYTSPPRAAAASTPTGSSKDSCLLHKKVEPACDLYVLETTPQPPPPPPSENWPPVWPLPKHFTNGTTTLYLALGFKIEYDAASDFLAAAVRRYEAIMFAHDAAPAAGELSVLTIKVTSLDDSHPQLETDEAYSLPLRCRAPASRRRPSTVRCVPETSAAGRFDFGSDSTQGRRGAITDAPRSSRGLMVDTAPLRRSRRWRIVDSLPTPSSTCRMAHGR